MCNKLIPPHGYLGHEAGSYRKGSEKPVSSHTKKVIERRKEKRKATLVAYPMYSDILIFIVLIKISPSLYPRFFSRYIELLFTILGVSL